MKIWTLLILNPIPNLGPSLKTTLNETHTGISIQNSSKFAQPPRRIGTDISPNLLPHSIQPIPIYLYSFCCKHIIHIFKHIYIYAYLRPVLYTRPIFVRWFCLRSMSDVRGPNFWNSSSTNRPWSDQFFVYPLDITTSTVWGHPPIIPLKGKGETKIRCWLICYCSDCLPNTA